MGDAANLFQAGKIMPFGQAQEANQRADALQTALLQHGSGPMARVLADAPGLVHQRLGAALDLADLVAVDVNRQRAEAARRMLDMSGDQFLPLIEDAYQPLIPARPDDPCQILRRHRVVSPFHFDVAVAVHLALGFTIVGKALRRQRQEGITFSFGKVFVHLAARGAVDARVGHGRFPVAQKSILLGQAGKSLAA
jgi:hypothetical protein